MTRELLDALAWATRSELDQLDERGSAHPGAIRDEPQMPAALQRVLTRAIASDRAEGRYEHAQQLKRHYTDVMPRMRIDQLASKTAVGVELMHARIDVRTLPRLSSAVSGLLATLSAAGVDVSGAHQALDARSVAELYARTYYGGCMPLLYGYPADLAYFLSRGMSLEATIDRYLTAPIIHELCHLRRDRRALCPHLDECVAGWLGVHVWPQFAFPEAGHDDALYASPWLAQIGAAMVRTFGLQPVLQAHAGDRDALPRDFIDASEALYWNTWSATRPLHFLADTFDPAPWLALIVEARELDADPACDRGIVEDALRAMCLETTQVAGSFRTRTVVPSAPIVIEPGRVSTAARTPLDTVAPAYWIPSTVTAPRHEVVLASIDEIPAIAAALVP